MHVPEYHVSVVAPYDGGTIGLYPVEEWRVKGSSLVPVYDSGKTPQDEPPMNSVTLIDTAAEPLPSCDAIYRAEGMNDALVCDKTVDHVGEHHLVSF